jgi:hypothetical protein
MTTSIASEDRWPVEAEPAAALAPGVGAETAPRRREKPLRNVLGLLDDAALLLLVALLFPVVILLIGTPLALLVRLILEIAQRL